jgi:hypothetical protein
MSQLVKTKRQANFKDFNYFKRFGAFKGLVEQKNISFHSTRFYFYCFLFLCLNEHFVTLKTVSQ